MAIGSNIARGATFEEQNPVLISLEKTRIDFDQGHAYVYELPPETPPGDNRAQPWHSQAVLFENGVALGPAHVEHDLIRGKGGGRYSHWGSQLYFSSSDNSSPLRNRRQYHLLVPAGMFSVIEGKVINSSYPFNKMAPMERFQLARSLYRKVWKETPLPDHGRQIDNDSDFAREFARLSPESDVTHERKFNLDQLFKLSRHIEGDVAECGVYKGASAYFLARNILEQKLNKRLCLFDSFEGLSVPDDVDGDYWYAGALAGAIEDVKNALVPLGPLPFVEFYKGWIPDRFSEVADRHFCFVHIDVDLNQPTLDSMAFFYPRMTAGGIILLDDYGFVSCPGVTAAIDQFLSDRPEPIINLASGGAFILKQAA